MTELNLKECGLSNYSCTEDFTRMTTTTPILSTLSSVSIPNPKVHHRHLDWISWIFSVTDLTTRKVVCIEDLPTGSGGGSQNFPVRVPQKPGNYHPEFLGNDFLRSDVKPLEVTSPSGPSFTVTGNLIEWQKFSIRIRLGENTATAHTIAWAFKVWYDKSDLSFVRLVSTTVKDWFFTTLRIQMATLFGRFFTERHFAKWPFPTENRSRRSIGNVYVLNSNSVSLLRKSGKVSVQHFFFVKLGLWRFWLRIGILYKFFGTWMWLFWNN